MMPTPIYHITHIDNFRRILKTNGLWSDAQRLSQGFLSVGIAHQNLKDRRARAPVLRRTGEAAAAGGVLADYVPFYFANRAPMLYAIHSGFVEGYEGGQSRVIYLASSIERTSKGDRKWCFTDGHALEAMTEFFDSLTDLDKVDWKVINSWSWKNTDADTDRKRRKQAEVLIHESFPWSWVEQVGVRNTAMRAAVQAIMTETGIEHPPPVIVQPKWYY